MTLQRRARDVLPPVLGDLARGPYPEYLDDVLAATARKRQRPAWTFLERWLPVDAAGASAFAPSLSRRVMATALLLIALLLAALAALYGGSRQPLPAPFGPARNGLVAYETGGDIYTADPATGEATAIISGPEQDHFPQFSLDGTRIAFERKLDLATSYVYVARADGTDLTRVTPEPVLLVPGDIGRSWERFEFSPDGREVVMPIYVNDTTAIAIAQADGSGMRVLDVGMAATELSYRPPDGREILFIGRSASGNGIYAVDVASGTVRPIIVVRRGSDLAGASWSPDGSRIVYWTWHTRVAYMTAASRVVQADGTGDRAIPVPTGARWNAHATWSNDGTRLFVAHGFTPGFEDVRGWVMPADGSSAGVDVTPGASVETECCAAWIWSPDDSLILGRSASLRGAPLPQVIIDVAARSAKPARWTSASDPTWQRVAP